MTMLSKCKDCESFLESEMVEVSTEKETDFVINLHLDYCRQCDEYKGIYQNFQLSQKDDAVAEKFDSLYSSIKHVSGKMLGYTVKVPLI